jgi:hypothetical protein
LKRFLIGKLEQLVRQPDNLSGDSRPIRVPRHLPAVSLLAGAALGCGDRVMDRMHWMDGAGR